MSGLVLLVTGTRSKLLPKGRDLVNTELDRLVYVLNPLTPLIVMHGDCPTGVDHFVNRQFKSDCVWPFPAQWDKQGKGAGFQRNTAMVATVFNFKQFGHRVKVLAFPSQTHSPGTNDCINKARKYGLDISVHALTEGIHCESTQRGRK